MQFIVTLNRHDRETWKQGETARYIRIFTYVLILILLFASPEWIYDMWVTPKKEVYSISGILEEVYSSNTNNGNYADVGIELQIAGEHYYLAGNVISSKKPEVLNFVSEIEKYIGETITIRYIKRVAFVELRSHVVEILCEQEPFFEEADALRSYADRSERVFEHCISLAILILVGQMLAHGIIQIRFNRK